jgi:hypothetical protein
VHEREVVAEAQVQALARQPLGGGVDDLVERQPRAARLGAAGLQPGEVEQVVDQRGQPWS